VTREEQFSILFRKHGTPLLLDGLPAAIKKKWEEQIGFYNLLDSSIYVGVLDNASFNAVASRNHAGEFIALYAGAIAELTLYSYQVFSDPDFYPNIGDASAEKYEPAIISSLKEGDISRAAELRYWPNCSTRKNVAERIAECACLVLFLHESAHIKACHIDLILKEFAISEYQEFNINPINAKESLLLRTLELEADTLALINSLNIWRDLVKRTGIHDVQVLEPTRVWLIACELLFWIMSFKHNRLRERQLPSHPSILTRYLNIRIGKIMQGEDQELRKALDQPGNTLLPWTAKHDFSTSILDFFQKEPFDAQDLAEWIELQKEIEILYPKLEAYQHDREERLST
jgi:hypothetical protein